RRVRLELATIELVQAPALDAVLELILLASPAPQNVLDELLCGRVGNTDDVELLAFGAEHRDAAHTTSGLAELLLRGLAELVALAAYLDPVVEVRQGELRVRLTLVGHELETDIAQLRHRFGVSARAVEHQQEIGRAS